MPDEPRRGGPGPRGDQPVPDDQPTGRRRRSMEGSGGLSVSELLEQHSRSNIPRPVPPTDGRRPEATGRRAAPEAEVTGRRAMPEPEVTGRRAAPEPEVTGRRAAPEPGVTGRRPVAEPQTGRRAVPEPGATGRRAVPEPPQTGRRAAPEPTGRRTIPDDLAPAAPTRPEDTGRRRRPTPEDAPPNHFGPESTGRRARPDLPAEQAAPRRAAEQAPPRRPAAPEPPRRTTAPSLPRDTAPHAPRDPGLPRDTAPREPSLPRDPGPRDAGLPRDAAAPRVTRRDLAATPHDASQTPPRDPAPGGARDRALRDPGRPTPRDLPPNGRPTPAGPRDTGPRDIPGGPRETGARDIPGGPRETGARDIPGGARDIPGGGAREAAARDLPGGGRRDAAPAGPRDLADGSGPRRLAEPGPSDTGRRPDPRRANGAGPDPRGFAGRPGGADGSGPRQFAPDGPGRPTNGVPGPDTTRRPADHDTGSHSVDPRRLAAGGPDTGRRLAGTGPVPEGGPNGTGPRRMPEGGPDGSGPRRMPEGGPDGSGPRRLAEGGPDGSGPRRLAEGGPDGSGPRRLAEGGPRRLAGNGPDVAHPAAAEGGDIAGRLGGAPAPTPPAPPTPAPTPRDQIDPLSLTTEMEAISDEVKKRREVDHTLARFSAVHDELAEQERQKKERRQKLLPWKQDHDEDATVFAEPLDDADDSELPRRRRARTAKHSKIVRSVKVLSLTGAVLVFVATGLGWGAMQYIDSKFTEIDALNKNSAAVHEAEKQLGDENFLIVGSDTRAGAKPEDGVGDAAKEPGARSDVLMLAHIPADRKRVVVVSVPRDLQITRPECEKWNWETGEYTGEMLPKAKGVKANQAYADGGPRCVSTFMTELTGLTINHFISVDFNGFKGMVDAVGKIKVCVPKVMEDEELGMIFDKPGQYEIDGEKALDYVRARKVTNEPLGDYDRVKRQQKFLSSLLRTALSSEMLLNPGKLNNFLNAFAASTVGQNIGVKDMLTLAQSLQGIEAGRVSFITVPHRTDEGPTKSNHDNIELLLENETKALFQAIIDGTPLPGETPDANPTAPNQAAPTSNASAQPKQGKVIDPKGLKIQVFNGEGGRDGAAKLAKDDLEELGFSVVNWGGGEATPKTVIRYGIGGEDTAATLAAAVPGATPEFRPEMGGSVLLLLGPEWDKKVVTPQPGGTAAQPGKTTTPPVEVVNAGVDPCA